MSRKAARPPIHLLEDEADKLYNLALGLQSRQPEVAELLLAEIERAKVHRAGKLPAATVAMHSRVEFVDEASGTSRTVQLVYPPEANIDEGRISILTPIGAGLIGLSAGQSILWPDRENNKRSLRIVSVTEAAAPAAA
ncbi:nucleoside diphosphate kinase regulator [Sandaracinobacteroides hominis]|uniref:nucleoside diphosphate kinase regulator n=1 Tax=Sandaracinobacteroides hominis TaxID=2780086 RepID=UPI0018F2DA60|nr:nucleoside diphosphate kinase regulator [Sandaracinobacteroides hominis]